MMLDPQFEKCMGREREPDQDFPYDTEIPGCFLKHGR